MRHFALYIKRSGAILSIQYEGRERRRSFRASQLPRTRLRANGYIAEIIENRRSGEALVHCVIQREDSSEILYYTQFATVQAARQWAEEELRAYAAQPEAVGSRTRLVFSTRGQRWTIAKRLGSGRDFPFSDE